MPEVQLVVFDMAGTTVHDDDSVNRCIRDALGAVGLVVAPAAVNAVMGLPKPEALAVLVRQHGREAALLDRLDAIHRDFVARSIAFYQDDPSVHEVAGAAQVFEELKRSGIRMIDDAPRPGAHHTRIAFIHPKSSLGVLTELCEPSGT